MHDNHTSSHKGLTIFIRRTIAKLKKLPWTSHMQRNPTLGYPQLEWNGVRFLEREVRSCLFLKNRIWNQIPSSTSLRDWNQNRNGSNLSFKMRTAGSWQNSGTAPPTLVYTYLIRIQIPDLYLPCMKIFLWVKICDLVKKKKKKR